jgi:hypothetical protein
MRHGLSKQENCMTADTWIVAVVGAFLAGAGLAWWITQQVLRARFATTLRRTEQALRQQQDAALAKMRADHTSARLELETQRSTLPRQIAAATAEQRATATRLEERLKMAYAELDRLRVQINGPAPSGKPERTDGFANTEPFRPGL